MGHEKYAKTVSSKVVKVYDITIVVGVVHHGNNSPAN